MYNFGNDASETNAAGIRLNDITTSVTLNFKNNIIYNTQSSRKTINDQDGGADANAIANFDYNCLYEDSTNGVKWGSTTHSTIAAYISAEEANSINSDPLYTDKASGDFSLDTGSPCIDAGVDVSLPFNGSAPDMGAIETEAATIAPLAYYQKHLNRTS